MSKQVETLESIRTGSKIPGGVVLLTPTVIILGTTLLGHLVTDPLGLSAGGTFLADTFVASCLCSVFFWLPPIRKKLFEMEVETRIPKSQKRYKRSLANLRQALESSNMAQVDRAVSEILLSTEGGIQR